MSETVNASEAPANVIQLPKPEDSNRFKFEGRDYLLYKRNESRDGSYYVRVQVGGKREKISLNTNALAEAVKRAKNFISKARGGKWEDVDKLKARRTVATIGEVLKLYLPDHEKGWAGLHGIKPDSAKNNAWSLGKVLRDGLGLTKPDEASLSLLNRMACIKFQDALVAARLARANADNASQSAARAQAENSSKSIILQARSVFNRNREMVRQYEERGLKVPLSIAEFMECKLQGHDTQRAEYLAPSDGVIEETFRAVEELRVSDPDVFKAFWLACGCGLRRGEILQARWEHFIVRDGKPWFSGGVGKDTEVINVPVQARAWKAIEPMRKPAGFVVESQSLEVARRIGTWMKQKGWETEKKLHELRAYVGSLIYMEDHMAAKMFMRHKSIKVTEQFYVRYGKKAVPDVL